MMIKYITNWLIKRRLKQLHIPVIMGSVSADEQYKRVLNTLRESKVMIKMDRDGIYMRMAGNEKKGEKFSLEWGKIVSL